MTEKEKKLEQDFRKEVEQDIKASNHKWEKLAAFVVIFIFSALAVFGVVWYVDNTKSSDDYVSKVTVQKKVSNPPKTDKDDWKTYANTLFGFNLKYPQTWTLTDNLQKEISKKGTAQTSLVLNNNEKYALVMWINPDGFGAEGQLEYVNFENTKVEGSKIVLGSRKYTKTETTVMGNAATGFRISTSFNFNGDDYVLSMSGRNSSDLVEAEKEFKDITSTFKWTK